MAFFLNPKLIHPPGKTNSVLSTDSEPWGYLQFPPGDLCDLGTCLSREVKDEERLGECSYEGRILPADTFCYAKLILGRSKALF